jgi:hypothetical protein
MTLTTPVMLKATQWLLSNDTGSSSKTMCRFFLLGEARGSTPSDWDDFGRCYRLLERIPEWRPRVQELQVIPGWEILAQNWVEIERRFLASNRNSLSFYLAKLTAVPKTA